MFVYDFQNWLFTVKIFQFLRIFNREYEYLFQSKMFVTKRLVPLLLCIFRNIAKLGAAYKILLVLFRQRGK